MTITIAQLRLATGTAAELIEALPDDGALQLFAARGINLPDSVATRIVVIHLPPPDGPTAGALLDRMASIRAAGHTGVAAPLATGEVAGQAWVVEPIVPLTTVARRLADRGGLSTGETVHVLRGVARALVALHRRGVAHGALNASVIALVGQEVVLHHLGRTVSTATDDDWRALGAMMQGIVNGGRPTRHQLPPALLALIARMASPDPASPVPGGSEVLGILDRFPAGSAPDEFTLVDGVGRGTRDPAERRTLLLAALAGVVVVVWFLLRGF